MAQAELEAIRRDLSMITPGQASATASSKFGYGTLDDVPLALVTSLKQLERLTTARFEGYHGVLYYGTAALDWPQHGHWGRAVKLASGEELEMRVWPKDALEDPGCTDSTHPLDLAFLATRVKHASGAAEIKTAVVFRPGYSDLGTEIEMVDVTNGMRIAACLGLHVLMAGLFKRHNPTLGQARMGTGMLAYDYGGYETLRSSTYSIFNGNRKDLAKTPDHVAASGASAGPSVFTIAYELLDMQLTDDVPRRAAEPITARKFKSSLAELRNELVDSAGKERAEEAMASAMAIVELMSAEGLIGLRANPFFDGALPDRIAGPHGPALGIALGMRLAINWADYDLPKPSNADLYANDQLRMIWNTCGMRALPIPEPNMWAIDLVLKAGLREAKEECDAMRKENGIAEDAELNIIGDNKIFWARLGQSVITRTFGLGAAISSQADSMDQRSDMEASGEWQPSPKHKHKLPPPWRFHDGTQRARDKWLAKNGIHFEGAYTPLVNLAPPGARRTALIRLALDCENWLRTGLFKHGTLSPANDVAHPDSGARVVAFTKMLRKIRLEKIQAMSYTSGKAAEPVAAVVLDREINTAAFEHAISSAQILLVHGPVLHLSQQVGTYVIAPSQCSPCSECEQPVHVLSGFMFKNTYSECTACHSKRCLDCTMNYGKVIKAATDALSKEGKSGPYVIGRKCCKCFADPAELTLKYGSCVAGALAGGPRLGRRVLDMHLSKRVPKRDPGALKGTTVPPSPSATSVAANETATFVQGAAAPTSARSAHGGKRKARK